MTHFLAFTVIGIVLGSVYAVVASGLVVTYTTSGIFNFAHGAMGMVMAFLYWQLRVHMHWPAPIALFVVLLVIAPLFGALVERVLMRNIRGSDTGVSLMVTLGLLLFLIGFAFWRWKATEPRALPEFFAGNSVRIFSVNVSWHDLITIGVAIAVAGFLRLLFFRTRTGVAMRAVVDDRDLTALNGARPGRVSAFSWALGTSLAALAGILLAPLIQLNVINLTFLVVTGYAAAVVGQLKSLPLTFAGALALGLGDSYANGYLHAGFLSHVKPTLPTFLLFAVLLFLPQVRLRVGRVVGARSPRVPGPREVAVVGALFVVVAWIVATSLSAANLATMGQGLGLGLIMLSLVLLVGYGGQVSLCQMTFVGLGAVVMAKISHGASPVGLIAAAALAGVVGAVISLPALRLTGLYLALATLAFAILADNLVFIQIFNGSGGGLSVRRLHFLFLSFRGDVAYTVMMAAAFALMGALVLFIRRGPFGRLLSAMKDSPAACATLGLDLTRTKIGVFALSAAMAGVGGALFGGLRGNIGPNDFIYIQSLVILLMATIGGITTVSGAFLGGMFLAVFPVVQSHIQSIPSLTYLGAGLGAMTIARSPNGLVALIASLAERFRRRAPAPGPAGGVGVPREVERVVAPVG